MNSSSIGMVTALIWINKRFLMSIFFLLIVGFLLPVMF